MKLTKETKKRITEVLYENWNNMFELIWGTDTDECGQKYSDIYKFELQGIANRLCFCLDCYIENKIPFNKHVMETFILVEFCGCLGNINGNRFKFYACTNAIYSMIFPLIKDYFIGFVYPPIKIKGDE